MQDVWQTEVDSLDLVYGIMNWDYTSYFDLLDERFKEMGVLTFRYWIWREEEAYDIYLSEKLEETVEIFHLYNLGELKMH